MPECRHCGIALDPSCDDMFDRTCCVCWHSFDERDREGTIEAMEAYRDAR